MSIPASLLAHTRMAWRPVTLDDDGPLDASKIAGTPWIPAGEARPVCPHCERPIQLFLQLNTADLPGAVRGAVGEGLIQLFYCTSQEPTCEVDCEAWWPFSDSVVARLVVPSGPAEGAVPDPEGAFPARRIVGWTAVEDVPSAEEAEAVLGLTLSDEEQDALWEAGLPLGGDKLGGWPSWVQGVEYPACPRCGETMALVAQLDSEDHLPVAFGDLGTGHLTQCPTHKDVLAFGWACG